MQHRLFLMSEFFILFILLPVSFAIPYSFYVKASLALLGFVYILYVLKKVEKISFKIKTEIAWKAFWKQMAVTGFIVILVTTAFVLLKAPDQLFFVPLNNPLLYIFILLVYTFLSVWPQEIIYRTFFFKRYEKLFSSKSLLMFVNAILFSLAHIFFKNTLVLVLTFIGGLLFGFTYLKFRSTTLVSIEHALYGNWLFTIGMGQMLAFPGMEV